MMNKVIIDEFEKLVSFTQKILTTSMEEKNQKEITANNFRLKNIKNALTIIKKYPYELTLENLNDFSQLNGIGKGTIDRIKEILKNGFLKELENFTEYKKDDREDIITELMQIVGVGRSNALDFYKKGITSIKDLKKKIKSNEIEVNEKITLGIKYHGKFFDNIPRKEIDKVYKLFQKIIINLNKKENDEYFFEICGSYRRGKPMSGDIDVLISKKNTFIDKTEKINYLEKIISILKKPIKLNNNQPLLVDDITDKNFETKYMGFSKYKDCPIRRIDIRFVPEDVFYSALLYFTGSAELNLRMRKIAKKQGLKLSEYGLTKEDGTRLKIESEYDIFKILEIEYLIPELR